LANWTQPDNCRNFFDTLGQKFGYKQLSDFYNMTSEYIQKNGGKALISRIFNGSIEQALKSAYPSHDWLSWKFGTVPIGFWDTWEHQRKFMDWLKNELNIEQTMNMYQITTSDIIKLGGIGLLSKYGRSIPHLLQAIYPENLWTQSRLSKHNINYLIQQN
jgi:hypothetical protein